MFVRARGVFLFLRFIVAMVSAELAVASSDGAGGDSRTVCASRWSDLSRSERLRSVRQVLPERGSTGLVNETEGSYFYLESGEDGFILRFYTTGLFDIYGIAREGPVQFCDTSKELEVVGLDRRDRLLIEPNQRVTLGDGGPKRTFAPGPLPSKIRRVNGLSERGLASED